MCDYLALLNDKQILQVSKYCDIDYVFIPCFYASECINLIMYSRSFFASKSAIEYTICSRTTNRTSFENINKSFSDLNIYSFRYNRKIDFRIFYTHQPVTCREMRRNNGFSIRICGYGKRKKLKIFICAKCRSTFTNQKLKSEYI